MGKLKVIKSSPLVTIQDFGRFGYRRYGIPQSGAMDKEFMVAANRMVGNPDGAPVVEFAMGGLKLVAEERTSVSVVGAPAFVNDGKIEANAIILEKRDVLEINPPDYVYGYLGIGGIINSNEDFGSKSTYLSAGFGGMGGRELQPKDILQSGDPVLHLVQESVPGRMTNNPEKIRILKGPEWSLLKELPDQKIFKVDPSSNRIGIRLNGNLACDFQEIASSAVVPGTIQLPSNGQPIVLMNDCQTTGGYPRIGKVLDEDLGKLAQVRSGSKITFIYL